MRLPGRQELAFLAICFAAASAVPFLSSGAKERFSDYGLGAPPLLMLAVATVSGTAALFTLKSQGFIARRRRGGLRLALRAATLLAVPAIVVDILHPFPADTNTPWPDAWLFYPAIAVVAEAVLHLVPLAALLVVVRKPWLVIPVVALTEPALQIALAAPSPGWQMAFVAVQVYVFGIVGLVILRRHGIVALLGFRWIYYLYWHILWGGARLPLLFAAPG